VRTRLKPIIAENIHVWPEFIEMKVPYKRLQPILLASLTIIILVYLSACGPSLPPGSRLKYENIAAVNDISDMGTYRPRLLIITNSPDSPVIGINAQSQLLVDQIDYSQYFLIVVFHGATYPLSYTPAKPMKINKVWQKDDNVYVLARFQPYPTYPTHPTIQTPYIILKVHKGNLIQSGNIIFTLFDQEGQVKTTTTFNFSAQVG
jgi:hypothetical protein